MEKENTTSNKPMRQSPKKAAVPHLNKTHPAVYGTENSLPCRERSVTFACPEPSDSTFNSVKMHLKCVEMNTP
jgi:hypothetical protein